MRASKKKKFKRRKNVKTQPRAQIVRQNERRGEEAKQQKGKSREEREVKNGRKGEVDKENKKV